MRRSGRVAAIGLTLSFAAACGGGSSAGSAGSATPRVSGSPSPTTPGPVLRTRINGIRQAPTRLALSLVQTAVDNQPCIHAIADTQIDGVAAREDAVYNRYDGRAVFTFIHAARLTVLQTQGYLYLKANDAAYLNFGVRADTARREAGIWFVARRTDPEFREFRSRAFFGYELLKPTSLLTKHIHRINGHSFAVFRGCRSTPPVGSMCRQPASRCRPGSRVGPVRCECASSTTTQRSTSRRQGTRTSSGCQHRR
jgi:hypothetical protein